MLQKVYYTVGEQKIRKSLIFNIQFLKVFKSTACFYFLNDKILILIIKIVKMRR